VLYVWWQGQISPPDVGLGATIELLVMAVIGGLWRIEGAWLGAFAFIIINNYVHDVEMPVVGGSFNTIIGLIFLAIIVVSPGGLMGLWGRLSQLFLAGKRMRAGQVAAGRTGAGS
jgi:branched-chain amino acid transport system permease protein